MSNAEPLVRARFCQEWLARVDKEDEPWRGRFFAGIDPGMRESIESASRLAWLPSAVHVELADILLKAFGVVRAHKYYRSAFAASVRGPFFGPLFRTGIRVAGISVGTVLRWAPRAWEDSFRNTGGLVGEVLGAGQGRLVYQGLPAVCTASDAWLTSAQGSVYGVYDLMGVEGIVRLDLSQRSEGRMILDLEWGEAHEK